MLAVVDDAFARSAAVYLAGTHSKMLKSPLTRLLKRASYTQDPILKITSTSYLVLLIVAPILKSTSHSDFP